MFQPSWWSKAISLHRKNFDILRLKNIAPYKECKGTLKDVQLKRSPDTVSSHTSVIFTSQYFNFKGKVHLEPEDPNIKYFPEKLI